MESCNLHRKAIPKAPKDVIVALSIELLLQTESTWTVENDDNTALLYIFILEYFMNRKPNGSKNRVLRLSIPHLMIHPQNVSSETICFR
jgi:hypothetical protein